MNIVVIGGGAAGFFGAIACAEANPNHHVILLEKARQVLSKVRISGGGRCNVTHSCFDPAVLVQNYPRGGKALRGPFTRFQPRDTIDWFESRGVSLKTEPDGRMFPITDNSETIIQCLLSQVTQVGVNLKTECGVDAIEKVDNGFRVHLSKGEVLTCDRLLLATGSSTKAYQWLESLGHKIEPPVPSLFTFNVPDSPLLDLSGVSLPKVHLEIEGTGLKQTGPLLLTHWGFSGPAVLKLSAWGARILHDCGYQGILNVDWIPHVSHEGVRLNLLNSKESQRLIVNEPLFDVPKNLWKRLITLAEIPENQKWIDISKKQMVSVTEVLKASKFQIKGKSTFKEEFVTCGGVCLDEVNFKTMESRICPGLYFAGEILNIDGITGGFNFQNAWTTSWIAAQALSI